MLTSTGHRLLVILKVKLDEVRGMEAQAGKKKKTWFNITWPGQRGFTKFSSKSCVSFAVSYV